MTATPPNLDDLLARLRAMGSYGHKPYPTHYINPDGPEAAEVIERLAGEVRAACAQTREADTADEGYKIDGSVYESAVQGRRDFREAYQCLLPVQRAAAVLCLLWRRPGERLDSDAFACALNDLDVAVCGGGRSGIARPVLESIVALSTTTSATAEGSAEIAL